MAQIRISFTSALVALSLAICLVVALAFVDRSRRDNKEALDTAGLPPNPALTGREQAFVQSAAFSEPGERPRVQGVTTGETAPQFNWNGQAGAQQAPAGEQGADLPIDPRLQPQAAPPTISAQPTAPRTPAELAALSPEALAKLYQGKVGAPGAVVPGATPPAIAVPEGMYYAKATPVPTPTPRAVPTQGPLPIITNTSGVDGALKNLGGSVAGISTAPGDPALPFSHPGTVSTDRLRAALAGNASLDPTSLLPNEDGVVPSLQSATNAGSGGWEATQHSASMAAKTPNPTPNPMYVVKGQARQASTGSGSSVSADPAVSMANPSLNPLPEDSSALLTSVISNDPMAPSPTPNFPGSTAPNQTPMLGPDNKWNLPPPPSLKGPSVQPGAALDPAKLTAPPGELPPSLKADDTALAELPTDIATKMGAGDKITAARVNERTLSAREAGMRADVLAQLEGRKLDDDNRRMLARTAAEEWAEMVALAEEARNRGISVAPSEFPALLSKMGNLDHAKLEQALRTAGLTPSEIESELRDLCLGEKLVEATVTEKFGEEKLKSIYEANIQEFQAPRRLQVREIFKAKPADAAEAKRVERDMDKLHQQAASGADFALLASQASEATTKANGGDLGWLDDRSDISETMAAALLPLKPGQVSGVVASADGYRIYKLIDVQEPQTGFEAARDRVVASLRDQVRSDLVERAVAKADMEVSHKSKKTKTASNSSSAKRDAEIAKVLKSSKPKPIASRDRTTPAPGNMNTSEAQGAVMADAPSDPANQGNLPAGFGAPEANVAMPGAAAGNTQAANPAGGPRGAVQSFFSKFRRPAPTIQQ